jgi:polyisoprenoid-binding protein YceI
MPTRFRTCTLLTLFIAVIGVAAIARGADEYTIDPAHTGVTFKISHLGLSWTHGRFDDVSGRFAIDPQDPSGCSFELTMNAEGIDTANHKRDDHLRSPDFFNVKQFPTLTFKSTAVTPIKDGYEVTGDFTMHGATRPLTLKLVGGKTAEFPKNVRRTGYSAEFVIKRSQFGITKFAESVGDNVYVEISFEGTKKK